MSDWLTLLPPILAIVVVFWRKEVILALLLALFCSELLLLSQAGSSVLVAAGLGGVETLERIVKVFESPGNGRILIFSLMVGALLAYMRESGGVTALVEKLVGAGVAKNQRQVGLLSFGTGVVVFIESNLSVLTAGIVSRGLFDRFKMSRARLAYIIDSTSAPVCILILLNGWGAYVLGMLGTYPTEQSAVSILIGTIPLNFYALFTLAVVLFTVLTGKVFGPMKQSEQELRQIHDHGELEIPASKARFMAWPLLTMVFGMLGFMLWTGNGQLTEGDGSKSVLYATTLACLLAYVLMLHSRRFSHKQLVEIGFKGMGELLPLVTIVLLSLALGSSLKQLGTGNFIAGLVADSLPMFLIPALLFLAGALISFTTGTSWGTFAILIPIGMPLVLNLGLPPELVLAAILGGGVFGDHCSPISDTTAVSSLASGCDLLEHVRTQLPYAIFCGALTLLAYLLAGLFWIG
ncbi:Na+/H+ antiporter NhaC family protein [Aliiglaciecola sp. CAU 1673]|uniref:Na+/H+ antiporter NhaC family protein n=1 Tax=Aliiglaciecola sp. CAU 1673 TaxID=3032595 RepID=UPI0023DC0508|nr:Na+/H+ antiporter NhaC family protein [Aliiglaciecola sp. CAU 1673]MDF2177331.1 Na+/H+ antiporter NhaC family protein [Aliiglaciecola sp. CAU 1673]